MRKLSPAAKVRARKEAELQTAENGQTRADLNVQQQMLAMLHNHKRALKQIQSKQLKGVKKADFVQDYLPYLEGVLKADSGQQDEVVITLMIWLIDAQMIDDALRIASYVLKHELEFAADTFGRTPNVAIAEEISELALKSENPVTPEHLTALYELVGETDMPDQVRVKLEKAYGLGLMETAPEQALVHLKAALNLSDKAGVKKQISALEKQLKDAADSTGKSDDDQTDENSASGETPEA